MQEFRSRNRGLGLVVKLFKMSRLIIAQNTHEGDDERESRVKCKKNCCVFLVRIARRVVVVNMRLENQLTQIFCITRKIYIYDDGDGRLLKLANENENEPEELFFFCFFVCI